MAVNLSLRIVSVNDPKCPPPKNWFVFNGDGTMIGPGTRDEAESVVAKFEALDLAKRVREWVFMSRRIANKYSAVFKNEYGFRVPEEPTGPGGL